VAKLCRGSQHAAGEPVVSGAARNVDRYLERLAGTLAAGPDERRDLLDEARDHLLQAAADHERRGAGPEAAARLAVEEFGEVGQLAQDWEPVLAMLDARRLAVRLIPGLLLVACAGGAGVVLVPGHDPTSNPGHVAVVGLLAVTILTVILGRQQGIWLQAGWRPWLLAASRSCGWAFAASMAACLVVFAGGAAFERGAAPAPWMVAGAVAGAGLGSWIALGRPSPGSAAT
jgi:hypothetical protein